MCFSTLWFSPAYYRKRGEKIEVADKREERLREIEMGEDSYPS